MATRKWPTKMPGDRGGLSLSRSMNTGWKIWLVAFAVVLFTISTEAPVFAEKISFRWAILADSTEGMRPLDFTGSPIVFSGTALQLYIEHLNNCHVYLYLLDSSSRLTPIYPPQKGYYDYGFPRGPRLVPPADQSFTFVPPAGTETMLLIVSAERLFQLEELTEIFNQNPDQMGQQELLLQEIEDMLKGEGSRARAAEGLEKVIVKYTTADGIKEKRFKAIKVKSSDFYGRKLLIDHR
ncbi:MAG: DUF4384 domain-containing protein [Desulfocapsaceae bacterium]